MKDYNFSQVIVLGRFLIGGKKRHLLRSEVFREELLEEGLLVPHAEVFGPADVPALELVAVAGVDHAKGRNLRNFYFLNFPICKC